jgi:hypothetical protein
MTKSTVRYISFPRTKAPPYFVPTVAGIFYKHEQQIGTIHLDKGLTSDQVLTIMQTDLMDVGFAVETGKYAKDKIERPVFFGENGQPTLQYEIDAYHDEWRCGLEIEAGQAVMGNAIYRGLVQALVMVQVDVLILAVPNTYKYKSGEHLVTSHDYDKTVSVAETLYSHSRFQFPYELAIIGY